jgi:internalin A
MFQPGGATGFVIEDGPGGRTLVVTGNWTYRTAEVLSSGDADGLVLNFARGYREPNLGFLQDWPVRRLQVLARTITDIDPIYRLADTLEELGLTTAPNVTVDVGRFPHLRRVWSDWRLIRESVARARRLQCVGISGYGDSDLLALAENTMLTSLTLKQAPRLQRLLGIESMTALGNLWIAGAHKLTDLASIPSVSRSLRELRFDTCGGITSLDDLASQRALSALSVANCGNVDSLRPISSLTDLTKLYLFESTRVVDGDLKPLLGLRNLSDFRMMNRKHYRPSVDAVKQTLGLAT